MKKKTKKAPAKKKAPEVFTIAADLQASIDGLKADIARLQTEVEAMKAAKAPSPDTIP